MASLRLGVYTSPMRSLVKRSAIGHRPSAIGHIPHNTILHAPTIGAVVAGDVIRYGINPLLAASTPEQWEQWIASVDKVASLKPRGFLARSEGLEPPTF